MIDTRKIKKLLMYLLGANKNVSLSRVMLCVLRK